MALGVTPLKEDGSEPLIRFYWHIDPEGAAPLVRAITTSLNDAGYAFRFKVLNDPSHFTRCDAAVLYTHKSDYGAIVPILERIYSEVARNLKPFTPVFTKQLAFGLGFAEDPGGAESFGMHRCRILAEGLVRAHDLRHQELKTRVSTVLETLEAEGIRIEAPFLNPGSVDNYQFRARTQTGHFPVPTLHTREQSADAPVADTTDVPPDYIRTAVTIGRGLVRDAICYGGLCNWLGASIEPNPRTKRSDTTFIALGSTLYTGTAGIAFFLGELWAAVPDDAFRETAIGAIKHAISRLDIITPSTRPGLYAGWAGIALVAGRLGKLFHEEVLVISASNIVKRLMQEESPDWEADLLLGRAGAIAALPILGSYLQDESLLAYAVRMAAGLLLSADKSWRGLSWKSDINRGVYNLTGLSHGASGIGFALLELWRITGETSYLQTAQLAFEYERSWFDDEAGNWPDFRIYPEEIHSVQSSGGNMRSNKSRQNRPFATAWCNGAPGIALTRLRAYELLSAEQYRAEASAALLTTKQAVYKSLESALGNYSLCHGLSGNAEILLYGRQVLGDGREHASAALSVARTVAKQGIDRYGDGNRLWPLGLPKGQTPNLMLGLAGIGHFYLRLYNPTVPSILLLRKEDWTRSLV